jgi:hypothetical protein
LLGGHQADGLTGKREAAGVRLGEGLLAAGTLTVEPRERGVSDRQLAQPLLRSHDGIISGSFVAGIGDDGSLSVTGPAGQRDLPSEYVNEHVELAFAATAYGDLGETVDSGHLVIGEVNGAAAAYVGMTRGRHSNVAHLVADSVDDARQQWIEVFSRDRADLGPGHAATPRRRGHRAMRRAGAETPSIAAGRRTC